MIYTKKDYQKFIDAMNKGKTVEVFCSCEWWKLENQVFYFAPCYYRVVEND